MKRMFPALVIGVLFLALTTIDTVFAEDSLQTLIDSTLSDQVLYLENKVYEGNITIMKPITIIGQVDSIIRGNGTNNVISIKSPDVHLENMTITNSGKGRNSGEEYAALKVHTDHNSFVDLTITDSFHGVYLSQAHYNIIKGLNISGSGNGEIASQGNGIQVYYSNYNTIEANDIKGTRDGMFFDYANHNHVLDNQISNNRYGLHYMYSDYNEFHRNRFTFNTGGAAIMNSNNIILNENEFVFNYGTKSFGLLLQSANYNQISKNTFYQNQRGLYIDQSTDNLINDNIIFHNHIGVELWASSQKQTFTENRFSNNIASVLSIGGVSDNKWSFDERGNYWGDENNLFDLNQDRVGDYPVQYKSSLYKLIEENELAYLFLKSPTIKVYEKINQMIGNQAIMFTDEYPLVEQSRKRNPLFFYVMIALLVIIIPVMKWGRR